MLGHSEDRQRLELLSAEDFDIYVPKAGFAWSSVALRRLFLDSFRLLTIGYAGLYDDRQRLVYTEQLQQVMSEDNDSQKQRKAEDRIGQR